MSRAAALPLAEQPMDVRLMNGVASGVFVLAGAALAAAALLWLVRAPLFTIRAVEIDGDLGRNSVNTIRANAMPRLRGNFFSLDLGQGREAFEAVPWVRNAVVRRVWPDRLAVRLEEHRPAAVWQGEDGNDRLVNTHGELFDANVGDVEDDGLPVFSGPDEEAGAVLAMYGRLRPLLAPLDSEITELHLSHRGSWSVELDNGATLELGRGSEDEVLARAARFVRTLPEVTARWRAPLEYADLRHTDGYAVRLRGVTTKTKTTN